MDISNAAIAEFKELYRIHFNIELSDEEAANAVQHLIGLVAAIQPNRT